MRLEIKNHVPRRSLRKPRKERSAISSIGLWLLIGMLFGIIIASSAYLLITGKWSILPTELITESQVEGDVKADAPEEAKKTNTAEFNKETKKLNTKDSQKPKTKTHAKKTAIPEVVQRFEFYQLLPGMEVPIAEPSVESSKKIPALAKSLNSPVAKSDLETLKPDVTLKTDNSSIPLEKTSGPHPKTDVAFSKSKTTSLKPQSSQKPPVVQKKLAAAQYLIQTGAFREAIKAENLKTRLSSNGFKVRIQKVEAEDGLWYRVILGPFPNESTALNQKIQLTKHKIQGILILQRK